MKEFEQLTSSSFNSINNINERADVLWELGSMVDRRTVSNKFHVKVYALFDFFVEVWVNTKKSEIERIFALENDKDWEGYLKSIRIADYF